MTATMFAPGPSRQVAAAPPMYAINSRRLMSFPKPKDDTLTSAEAVVHHSKFGRLMSEMGLGCVKTVLLVVWAEDKCEQNAARA
jgi:hypothetical protein